MLLTRNTRVILAWEFTQKVKSRGFIFSVLFMPLVIFGFTLLPMYFLSRETDKPVAVGIMDETGFLGEMLVLRPDTANDPPLSLSLLTWTGNDAIEEGRALVKTNALDAVLVLSRDILDHGNAKLIFREGFSSAKLGSLDRELNRTLLELRLKGKNLSTKEVQRIVTPVPIDRLTLQSSEDQYARNYLAGIILVMMLYFAISNSAGSFLRGVTEEKNSRVIEMLVAAVRPSELMTGKILGLGGVGLLQIAIWISFGALMGRYANLALLSWDIIIFFIIYFVLGYFFFAGIFSLLGSIFASEHDIQPIQAVVSLLGILPVALAFLVLQEPDSILVKILSYVPFLTPTLMILRIVSSEPTMIDIATTIGTMIFFLWLSLRTAGKVFAVGLLMYGKRLSMKELFKWASA